MRRLLLLLAPIAFALAACGSTTSATSASASSPKGATKRPQGGAGTSSAEATVGATGYGGIRFGMPRAAAEQAMGDSFAGDDQVGACLELMTADEPEVQYLFLNGALQRIDVATSAVMADGGGRVGMEADDLHTLYPGRLADGENSEIPGGHSLTLHMADGSGVVFETNGNGVVTAFHAATAAALDRADGCH